jgi:hypothetical protein
MARWFHNRPSDHCDEHEIKVAKLLSRLSKRRTPSDPGPSAGREPRG